MQFFDRSLVPPPAFLKGKQALSARRRMRDFFADTKSRSQSRAPDFDLPLDHPSVSRSLEQLFRGKCAFCETVGETSPYRFRPSSDALPARTTRDAHLCYAWLANAWENIFSICEGCRPAQPKYFPVRGERATLPTRGRLNQYVDRGEGLWGDYPPEERSLLIDPCVRVQYYRRLRVMMLGQIFALRDDDMETLKTFNLNRPELCERREKRFEQYSRILIRDPLAVSTDLQTHQILGAAASIFDFPALEFGGAWYLLLRGLALDLAEHLGAQPVLSQERIGSFLLGILERVDGQRRILDAFARLRDRLPVAPEQEAQVQGALTAVEIRNFKGLEHIELQIPAPPEPVPGEGATAAALLILGENSAGKSSLLEAIALGVSGPKIYDDLRCTPAELMLNPTMMGAPVGPSREVSLTFTFGEQKRVVEIGHEGLWSRRQFNDVAVFAYGAFRQYGPSPVKHTPHVAVRSLFDSYTLLSNPEKWLLSIKSGDDFNMVIRALRSVLSIAGGFHRIDREGDRSTGHCVIVFRTPRAPRPGETAEEAFVETRTPLMAASSGFRSVLAMVCDILEGLMLRRKRSGNRDVVASQAIILIDEVEAHLHPRWKMQIMRGLRAALPAATFIVTSHDPLCLRGMHDGEVAVLHRVTLPSATGDQLPVRVVLRTDLPDVARLSVEQLLTSNLFDLFTTDAPELERDFAQIADILVKKRDALSLSVDEEKVLRSFQEQVNDALPVGSTAVQRLVQDAVADHLQQKRLRDPKALEELEEGTRRRILLALEGKTGSRDA